MDWVRAEVFQEKGRGARKALVQDEPRVRISKTHDEHVPIIKKKTNTPNGKTVKGVEYASINRKRKYRSLVSVRKMFNFTSNQKCEYSHLLVDKNT